MNLRHLQFFVMLTDELNFSRAAERLHVAQPALSRQISLLEQRLGAQLFDRSGRPLRLTEAGHYFSAEARQLLAEPVWKLSFGSEGEVAGRSIKLDASRLR
ncbi:LysR family transcriptional regulator [Paraburkholderia sp. RL16-012-BIC-B]|nr:LysR family transcriptional regulator [Paraburkholderia madseniana]